MKRLLPLLSLLAIVSCSHSDNPSSPEPHPQADMYAVLTVALTDWTSAPRDSVMLVNETIMRGNGMRGDPGHRAYIKEYMPTLLDETIDDLTENEREVPLDPSGFIGPLHIRLVTNEEIREFFTGDPFESWTRFLEEFEGYRGYFRTTHVGFNEQKDQALVFMVHSCGPLCGAGAYMLLSKSEGEWARETKLVIWVS